MSAPRVLHIVQSGDRGGVQRHVRDLAIGLAPLTAGVLTGTKGWLVEAVESASVSTVLAPSLRRAVNPAAVAAAGAQARRAAAELQATVVHAHGVFALLAARSVGHLPLVYTAHGFQWRDPAHPAWLRALSLRVHRQVAPRLAALIAVSEQDGQDAARLGLPRERIHQIPNGVPLPAISPARLPPRVIGTAGRLVQGKNTDALFRFLALLPADVTLWVAGDGPALGDLRQLAADLRLSDRVHWLGWQDDLGCDFYPGIGVYATLSRKEGMPYAVLDAMAYGLPVVTSAIPAHQEIVAGSPWGALVTDGKLGECVERVMGWLSDAAAWQESCSAARRDAAQRFSADAMLRRTEAVYRQVLARQTVSTASSAKD